MQDKSSALRAVLSSEDPETIRKATQALLDVVSQLGAAAYQQAGPQATPGEPGDSGGQPGGEEEEVVDGEFNEA